MTYSVNRYICVGLPFFSRDFLMNAYAVDVVQEHNKVLILGESLPEDAEDAMNRANTVPWRAVGWFHNRLIVKDFKAIIEITSPTSAKVITTTNTTPSISTTTLYFYYYYYYSFYFYYYYCYYFCYYNSFYYYL